MVFKVIKIILLLILFTNCSTFISQFDDIKLKNAEQNGLIYIGMDFTEIVNIIGRKPNQFLDTWITGADNEGTYQIWGVNARGGTNFMYTYYFKFRNYKLQNWWCQ